LTAASRSVDSPPGEGNRTGGTDVSINGARADDALAASVPPLVLLVGEAARAVIRVEEQHALPAPAGGVQWGLVRVEGSHREDLAQLPKMREVPGKPGRYSAEIGLPMPGTYDVKVQVASPIAGEATERLSMGVVNRP
jgi:hypothetical protein